MNNLLPFYRDVLGLGGDLRDHRLRGTRRALGGGCIARCTVPTPTRLGDMIGLDQQRPRGGDWKRLNRDAGVEFIEAPTDYGTVRIATLKDPEGNLVQLLESARAT